VLQHGVRVQYGTLNIKGFTYSIANGGPGTPVEITSVDIIPSLVGRELRSTVAHELLHCCNVYHHGELDGKQYWNASDDESSIYPVNVDQDGAATGRIGFTRIKLFAESDPEHEIPTPALFKVGKPVPVWIGMPHGQHSGDEECVMRYDCAVAYPKNASANEYFWVFGKEPTGESLCHAPEGHDFNKVGRSPQPRYLDADQKRNRGRCAEQIDVNDANRPQTR
jgi:hypothetical protein